MSLYPGVEVVPPEAHSASGWPKVHGGYVEKGTPMPPKMAKADAQIPGCLFPIQDDGGIAWSLHASCCFFQNTGLKRHRQAVPTCKD